MNGHIFQCFNEFNDKNQFPKTVKALGWYITNNLKFLGNMMPLTKELIKPTIKEPEDLDASETSKLKITLWEKKVAGYATLLDHIKSKLKAVFTMVWGQCSKAMRAKLKSLLDYKTKDC